MWNKLFKLTLYNHHLKLVYPTFFDTLLVSVFSFLFCSSLSPLLFLDPKWRKCSKFSQRAGSTHTGPGVCRRHQLLRAPDGAARGHLGCSALGVQAKREGLSWTQLQQGAEKILSDLL